MKSKSRRPKNNGCLTKRGKYWTARVVRDGRVYTKSLHTTDKREAEKLLAEFAAPFLLMHDKDVVETFRRRVEGTDEQMAELRTHVPLGEVWDRFINSGFQRQISKATEANYHAIWKRFIGWLAKADTKVTRTCDISKNHAADYISHMRKAGLCNSSISVQTVALKHIFSILRKEGMIATDIWDGLAVPKIDPSYRRAFTPEELERLNAEMDRDEQLRTVVTIALYTGLRLGDCCLLKWEHIDMARGIISLAPHKTARTTVTIPIVPQLQSLLERTSADQRTGFVHPALANMYQRGRIDNLGKRFRHACKRAGIATTTVDASGHRRSMLCMHAFRHTFISVLANSGMSLDIVKRIVGHARASQVTDRYFHVQDQKLMDGVRSAFGTADFLASPNGDSPRMTTPVPVQQSNEQSSPTPRELVAKLLAQMSDQEISDLIAARGKPA